MDPRLSNLSYSSLMTLHKCPRKFQLYRLNASAEDNDSDGKGNLTYAFGHVVGQGIQDVLEGKTYEQVVLTAFLGFHADLYEENTKQNKSFWTALLAIQKFIAMREEGYLHDYELVFHDGKPAVELGFRISFPDGFKFRGFVDVVLRHRETGEVVVLELKTSSSASLAAATYKNSAQAIGYSVVLDVLFPHLSSYRVIYLVYLTKSLSYEQLDFTKTYLQRALWIQELLLDIECIRMYENVGIYPMRGESCYDFFRECEYLNICTLSTSHLVQPYDDTAPQKIETFNIELSLGDLIDSQLSKAGVQS